MNDQPFLLSDVVRDVDHKLRSGSTAAARVVATGFEPLDTYLGGGLRSGELTLLGGPQGLGKTTMALQMLRNVVVAGGSGIYFSYEHDPVTVLERMLSIEAAVADGIDAAPSRRIREVLENLSSTPQTLSEALSALPGGGRAVEMLSSYANRLLVHRSSGAMTDVAAIRAAVETATATTGAPPLVVVDYLQKVPLLAPHADEDERVTYVVQGLKDLSLEFDLPMLAIVAADREGITSGRRLRVYHLRGASALAYEADVVLVLNDKYDVVARHHLIYDVGNAERFRDYAVVTIEKNRTGLDRLDLEFRKRFEQGRFETEGRPVREQLVDERVFTE